MQSTRPTGMRAFVAVWLGQVISLLGTEMTLFALILWAYERTGSATTLALMGVFGFAPNVLLGPLAGALVDRWNRKLVMVLSDLGAGVATVVLLLLLTADQLQIWHLYAAGAFASAFQAFQAPAYSAAVTTMVPKEQYARANGMLQVPEAAAMVVSPALAAILLGPIGIAGVLTIDVITFSVAVGVLLLVQVPRPRTTQAGLAARGSLLAESVYGFRYILQRSSLLGLQLVFFVMNFTGVFANVVTPAMILARTHNDEVVLGTVQSAAGVGMLCGSLLMSAWGGPKRKIRLVFISLTLANFFGLLVRGLGQEVYVWSFANFVYWFALPIVNGSNQAVWQLKVAPDIQGRVFAARRLIGMVTAPLAMLLSGPLADRVFEPAMAGGGLLTPLFGRLVGTGPGAGMAVMFLVAGALGMVVSVVGYSVRVVRQVETILPDHDAVERAEGTGGD